MRVFLELDNICLYFGRGVVNVSIEIPAGENIELKYSSIKDYSEDSADYPERLSKITGCSVATDYFVIRERLWPDESSHPFPMHVSKFMKTYPPKEKEINGLQ